MNGEFTCAQCRAALPDYGAGTLAGPARRLVEDHLTACAACRSEEVQWAALAGLARRADAQTPSGSSQAPATWAAITARIQAESPVASGAHRMPVDQHTSPQSRQPTPLAGAGRVAPRRIPIVAFVAAALLVVLAAILFANHPRLGTSPAAHGSPTSVSHPPTTAPVVGLGEIVYADAVTLTSTDMWAVGNGSQRQGEVLAAAISHFDGKQWSIDSAAIFPNCYLSGIAFGSADDGWVVGSQTTNGGASQQPILIHYTGGRWVPQTLNMPDAFLNKVQMFGPDDGWAWGGDSNHGPIVFHYQHGAWTPIPFAPTHANAALAYTVPLSQLPPGMMLIQRAQFLSDTEGWAEGSDGTDSVVWRFHNGQWQTALRYTQSGVAIFSLGANSPTDVWVLGNPAIATNLSAATLAYHPLATHSSLGAPILLHFDGQRWTTAPVDNAAGQSFLDGATWLTRYDVVNQRQMVAGLLLNQGGTWRVTTFPQPVTGVLSATPQPDGSTLAIVVTGADAGPQTPAILRYANGMWSVGG